MFLMMVLIKYVEYLKSLLRIMYVWLDVRFDLIFNVNKVGRLNECIFIYFMYNKKNKK